MNQAGMWLNYIATATKPHTVVGTLKVRRAVASPQLDNKRDLLVHLPPSYHTGARRYPVIYMHDGQNLFDAATSYAGEWQADETLERLARSGLEAIAVGIPNTGVTRCDEYSPFRDARSGGGRGDDYLDFVVDTVKPLIDRSFRTRPERRSTGILGSSMGGLISLYAFFRHPTVFGFAGVLSPSFWFARGAIFRYLRHQPHVPGQIYLDMGMLEGRGMVRDVRRMRDLLLEKGYTTEHNLVYREAAGAHHSEAAWASRLHVPLTQFIQGAAHENVEAALPVPGVVA